jgi:localization factor PodJL
MDRAAARGWMMRSGVQWSIRGIDDDIREAARAAARRSGLSVSEWLNDLIAEQTAGTEPAYSRSRQYFEDDDSDLDAIADAVQQLTGRIRTMDDNSRAALSDLQRRFDALEDRTATAARLDRRDVARPMDGGLRDRAGSDRDEIGTNRVAEAIRNLDARISAMSGRAQPPPADDAPAKLEAVKAHLDALLDPAPEQASSSDDVLEATLRSLESHIEQAESRLSASQQAAPSPSMSAGDEERMGQIEEELAAITDEIAAGQTSERADSDFATAIDEIAVRQQKIDELADFAALAGEQRQVNSSLVALRADITALADRITTTSGASADDREANFRLAECIDELARRTPDKEQLESRLDAIATRVDGFLEQTAPADAIGELHERFSALVERLDAMSAKQAEPLALLDEIKSEISEIRGELAERAQPKINHIEEQLAELAERLDSATNSEPQGEALAELEARIAHLASEIERSMPHAATLKQIEDELVLLQGNLSESRQESLDAVRSAAQAAVQEVATPPGDSELVRALKDDLGNIRAAAGESDQRMQQTLGSVQGTLARVVERLTQLEKEGVEPASANTRGAAKIAEVEVADAPVLRAEPASEIDPLPASPGDQEDYQPPLADPSKPDLAALRELARSASESQPEKKTDRRADFIAAARRAAQAAAVEAGREFDNRTGDDEAGTFTRIGLAIRNRKRPLLLAAAALVLAISAVHLFGERGVRMLKNSPDAVDIGSNSGDTLVSPLRPGEVSAKMPVAVTVPKIGNSALVAPPPDVRAAIAFADPVSVNARFTVAPTAIAFAPAAGDSARASHVAPLAAFAPRPESTIGPSSLRRAAEVGDPAAAFEVAARYAGGKGVRRDLAKAAEWYERAAQAGVAVAQYRLGSLLERGQGVAMDRSAAVTWYQRAADQGNTGAMHNLAVMMSEGVDGTPDHGKAFEWFLAAASYGVTDSQYNLGVAFARGLAPTRNMVESYKWFALAAAAGDADASARRDEIAKSLSPDDLVKARAAAKAWRVTPSIAEANSVGGWDQVSEGVTAADRRALVIKIQALLAEQGYDPGPLDGFEGPKTREAVRAFQRNVGLSATGNISGDLATVLASRST